MHLGTKDTKLVGILMLAVIGVGVLSISPEVDSAEFLTAASENAAKVTSSGVLQFVIALLYLSIAILLFPTVHADGAKRAIGYLCLTAIAASIVTVGSVIISAVLLLSQELAQVPVQDPAMANAVGQVLKVSRDFTNHGYMVLALCAGKLLLFSVLYGSGLIPRALSAVGIAAALLSMAASLLVLFQVLDVVTPEYIGLNAPTALHEILLGIWFTVRAQPLQ